MTHQYRDVKRKTHHPEQLVFTLYTLQGTSILHIIEGLGLERVLKITQFQPHPSKGSGEKLLEKVSCEVKL